MNIILRHKNARVVRDISEKYDLDSDRFVSTEEVQAIILDLKQSKKSQGLLRDLGIVSCLLLSILAITSLHPSIEAESKPIIPRQLSTNDVDFDDWAHCEAMATVPLNYFVELDNEETGSDEPVFLCKPSPGECEKKSSSVPSSYATDSTTEFPTSSYPTNGSTKSPSNLPTISPTIYLTNFPTPIPTDSLTISPTYPVKKIDVDWYIPWPEPYYPRKTARVGDTVVFTWRGYHNVYIHPTNNCEFDGRILIGNGSPASYTFRQDDIGVVTFACDIGAHCQYGQIINFTVTDDSLVSPAPSKKITKSPTISPTALYCTEPDSNCYKTHNRDGCDDSLCRQKVCTTQPSCCTKFKSWTRSCRNLAFQICRVCQETEDEPITIPPYPGLADLQAKFPDLPYIGYVKDSPKEAGIVSNLRLAFRSAQTLAGMRACKNNITLQGETRESSDWWYAGTGVIPPEQQHPYENPIQFVDAVFEEAETSSVSPEIVDRWVDFFTNTDVAEEDFWPVLAGAAPGGTCVLNQVALLEKVSEMDLNLTSILPLGELEKGYEYYKMDTRSMARIPPHEENDRSPTRYAVGALIILRQEAQGESLKPSAVILSTNSGKYPPAENDIISKTYNPDISTPSAWRLALLAARASISMWGVSTGHILSYHVTIGAMQAAILTQMDHDHPFRTLMAPFILYTMQFNTMTLDNTIPLSAFPFENDAPDLENFMPVIEGWQELITRVPFVNSVPSRYLPKNGILAEDHTSCVGDTNDSKSSKCEDWDLFPFAGLFLKVEQLAASFIDSAISVLYTNNQEIENDSQLQALVSSMKAEDGGNLGAITPSGKMKTIKDLKDLATTYMYNMLVHGTARTTNLTGPQFPPNGIPSLMNVDFLEDDDEKEYTIQELMSIMPNTHVMGEMAIFISFFERTTPYIPLIPVEGSDTNLLFDNDEVNNALIELREGFTDLITTLPNLSGIEDTFPKSPLTDLNQWPQNSES